MEEVNSNIQGNIQSMLSSGLLSELRRLELVTKRKIDTDMMGRYRSAFRGSGLIFSDLREYQPGDDVKHIHWKVTARTGHVFVKSYDEDRQLRIMLLVDTSNSTGVGSFDGDKLRTKHQKALEFAALISILAAKSQDAIGLSLFSDKVEDYLPPKKSRTQFKNILLKLMTPRPLGKGTDLTVALRHLNEQQRKASIVFVVSDFHTKGYEDELRKLAFRHDVILVLLEDKFESSLPAAGIVELVDAESGNRFLLDTSDKKARETLAALHEKRVKEISAIASRSGADLVRILDNPLSPIADLMQRRTSRLR